MRLRVCRGRESSSSPSTLAPRRTPPIMPSAPARATADANSAVATPPMPACWIGTLQPISLVKRVVNTSYSSLACLRPTLQ
jgi:hypothetical protein